MKYLKLFEEYRDKFFIVKKSLPNDGIVEVDNVDELRFLYNYFLKKGYTEGCVNEFSTVESWFNKDWKNHIPSKEKLFFQWVSSRPGGSIYAFPDHLHNADHDTVCKLIDFDTYIDYAFIGMKMGKKFGL